MDAFGRGQLNLGELKVAVEAFLQAKGQRFWHAEREVKFAHSQ